MGTNHDFRTGRSVIYELHAHLVFTPKYRHHIITDQILTSLEPILRGLCENFETGMLRRKS